MGLFGREKKKFEGIDSVIGEKANFKGEIITSGSVNINGEFEGKIKAEGEVILSPGSRIVGDIHGGVVIIAGRVDGNITAIESLEINRSGRVHGDLIGGKIIIEEGSSYHGKVKVESETAEEPEEPKHKKHGPTLIVREPSAPPAVEEKPGSPIFPSF